MSELFCSTSNFLSSNLNSKENAISINSLTCMMTEDLLFHRSHFTSSHTVVHHSLRNDQNKYSSLLPESMANNKQLYVSNSSVISSSASNKCRCIFFTLLVFADESTQNLIHCLYAAIKSCQNSSKRIVLTCMSATFP